MTDTLAPEEETIDSQEEEEETIDMGEIKEEEDQALTAMILETLLLPEEIMVEEGEPIEVQEEVTPIIREVPMAIKHISTMA